MSSLSSIERYTFWFARFSLGIIFVWFGILKLIGVSPVIPVIEQSFPFIAKSQTMYAMLGWFEVVVGVGILIPAITTVMSILIIAHLIIATTGVLISPQSFINGFPVLSVVGEFVIKNIALIALTLMLAVCRKKHTPKPSGA